jgi:anti-sigma B factor antagonist
VPQDRPPAPMTRHLRVRHEGGLTVAELRGEIDIASYLEIEPHLDRLTAGRGVSLVIDLRRVDFFDCSGLRLLSRARYRLLDRDGRLHLVCADPVTLRILRVTGVDRLLPPLPSLDAILSPPVLISPEPEERPG